MKKEAHKHKSFTIRENGSIRVQTIVEKDETGMPVSETQQQFKDDCDVNKILKAYNVTSMNQLPPPSKGVFGDFSEIPSYQEMLHTVQASQEAFASLPSQMRLRFNNDPQELLSFLQDPRNTHEAVSLGLMEYKQQTQNSEEEKNQNKNQKQKTKNNDEQKQKIQKNSQTQNNSVTEGDE